MAGFPIIDATGGTPAAVGANSKAMSVSPKPVDVGSLGSYTLAGTSGIMAAGIGGPVPIWAFRYGGANLAVVKRVLFTMSGLGTAFAAGQALFNLFVARSFTVSDTGGGSITPTGNGNKLRTSFGATAVADARISATAAMSTGTRTLDAQPIGAHILGIGTTASIVYIPQGTPLFAVPPGAQPLQLVNNEGLELQATLPGTGTWCFGVTIDWDEITSF